VGCGRGYKEGEGVGGGGWVVGGGVMGRYTNGGEPRKDRTVRGGEIAGAGEGEGGGGRRWSGVYERVVRHSWSSGIDAGGKSVGGSVRMTKVEGEKMIACSGRGGAGGNSGYDWSYEMGGCGGPQQGGGVERGEGLVRVGFFLKGESKGKRCTRDQKGFTQG